MNIDAHILQTLNSGPLELDPLSIMTALPEGQVRGHPSPPGPRKLHRLLAGRWLLDTPRDQATQDCRT